MSGRMRPVRALREHFVRRRAAEAHRKPSLSNPKAATRRSEALHSLSTFLLKSNSATPRGLWTETTRFTSGKPRYPLSMGITLSLAALTLGAAMVSGAGMLNAVRAYHWFKSFPGSLSPGSLNGIFQGFSLHLSTLFWHQLNFWTGSVHALAKTQYHLSLARLAARRAEPDRQVLALLHAMDHRLWAPAERLRIKAQSQVESWQRQAYQHLAASRIAHESERRHTQGGALEFFLRRQLQNRVDAHLFVNQSPWANWQEREADTQTRPPANRLHRRRHERSQGPVKFDLDFVSRHRLNEIQFDKMLTDLRLQPLAETGPLKRRTMSLEGFESLMKILQRGLLTQDQARQIVELLLAGNFEIHPRVQIEALGSIYLAAALPASLRHRIAERIFAVRGLSDRELHRRVELDGIQTVLSNNSLTTLALSSAQLEWLVEQVTEEVLAHWISNDQMKSGLAVVLFTACARAGQRLPLSFHERLIRFVLRHPRLNATEKVDSIHAVLGQMENREGY